MKIDKKVKAKLKDQLVKSLQHVNKQTVYITTPFDLNPSQLAYFKEMLHMPDSVSIETITDKDLIGGFVIRCGSNIIDASITAQVNNLVGRLENIL